MNQIGVIGLAVMGSNLALNIADHDTTVAVYNRTTAVTENFMAQHPHKNITMFTELKDFVESLEQPRKIILMVQSGSPVDRVIDGLLPYLDQGDIIMDGGNSYFPDTIRRSLALEGEGFHYLGVGISGGEDGARFGPAIMPGGDETAYARVAPIFEKIAATYHGEPCVAYIGDNGAGHFVKMVHNGIEYADMQLIAETYSILKHVGNLSNSELATVFESWNQGRLESYLIEITAQIFKEKDPQSKADLVDMILDKAAQKGTGKWTAIESFNTGTDASLLASAVYARFMSSYKEERIAASQAFELTFETYTGSKASLIEQAEQALYASKIIAYAQGFSLMANAARDYGWTLDFASIARIFREGCIIRAQFLNLISDAYTKQPQLVNLMLDDHFKNLLLETHKDLRLFIVEALTHGVATPALNAAISYFDGYITHTSGANLIQAQRDLFGAHTFERIDVEGHFHHDWN